MANELQTRSTTGTSVYAIIRNSSLQIWNPEFNQFETEDDMSFTAYPVVLTEQGDTGFFYADFPTAISNAGVYSIEFFTGIGIEGDTFIAGGNFSWSGTAEVYSTTDTALTSLSFVKDYCNITVSTYDTYLTNRINAISAAIVNYCNRKFALDDYDEYYDGPGSTSLLLKQTPVTAITSVTLNAQDTNPTVVSSSNVVFTADGFVSVKPSSTVAYSWFSYDGHAVQQNIRVQYSAGYATIPLDVQEACALAVRNAFLQRGADVTLESERIGDYSYARRADAVRAISNEVAVLLTPYKEFVV